MDKSGNRNSNGTAELLLVHNYRAGTGRRAGRFTVSHLDFHCS